MTEKKEKQKKKTKKKKREDMEKCVAGLLTVLDDCHWALVLQITGHIKTKSRRPERGKR